MSVVLIGDMHKLSVGTKITSFLGKFFSVVQKKFVFCGMGNKMFQILFLKNTNFPFLQIPPLRLIILVKICF